MREHNLDPTFLEIFLAVAEQGSVTRAARQLGRAPSNVSTRIQNLEEELGASLFSREGKRMNLTREGGLFLPYAKRLTALAREARLAVKPFAGAGILRVGTMESTAASRLPPVLRRLSESHPGAHLPLTIAATRELIVSVLSDELDCAFVAKPPAEMQPEWHSTNNLGGLCATTAYEERLLLVLPASHPPLQGPGDVQVQTLAALEPGCTYRNVAERWLGRGGYIRTSQMNSYHSILATVLGGNAIGVVPESVLNMLNWTSDVRTHEIACVETVLVRKPDYVSDLFTAFERVVVSQSSGAPSGHSL